MNEELPEGWAFAPLNHLISPSSEKVEPGDQPEVPYLSLEHIEAHTNRIIGRGVGADVNSTKVLFRSGDVLYGKLRPYLNKVAIPTFDGICSTDILVFSKRDYLDSGFLLYFLSRRAVVEFAEHNSAGVQLPRISFKALGTLEVPLPPLAEQRRIVAKVEQILARVNAARERLGRVPATLKRFRQSVLAAACSGRLTADWRDDTPWQESTLLELLVEKPRNGYSPIGVVGPTSVKSLTLTATTSGVFKPVHFKWVWLLSDGTKSHASKAVAAWGADRTSS